MLSRHADAAYWIGRYVERAEATARMVDVHYHFGLENGSAEEAIKWSSILAITSSAEEFHARYQSEDELNILKFFALDEDNPISVRSSINQARANARSIRDQISSEMWEQINAMYLEMKSMTPRKINVLTPHRFFLWVKNSAHLMNGITNRTLMLGETRNFYDAGKFLERADQTTRLLDVKYHDLLPRYEKGEEPSRIIRTAGDALPEDPTDVGGPIDIHGWTAVLKSVGAYEAFLKTFHEGVTPTRVVQFLVLNPKFPASARHSIGRVADCLRRISGNRDLAPANDAERSIGRLYNDLNYTTAEEIIAGGLHEFLESVQERCNEVGDAIFRTYLRF